MHYEPWPCSVGIGLGSHDLGVADVTVGLYQRGKFPLIVFTGPPDGRLAIGCLEEKLSTTVSGRWNWVFPNQRSSLPRARNTGENVNFARALLEDGSMDVSSVLLVSKPYEEQRAYATASKLWPAVEIISASSSKTL
ncbi:YdcF family protein [Streptomyces niveus]|uniref:YdcF family protein n=1 Tax=Streptomyces niveus TaxID=193462 RepID=UPI00341705C8